MDPDGHTARPAMARLLVADWTIDPGTIVNACDAQDPDRLVALHVVVPAWLHGLDWVGDPRASVPCAQRQLDRIARMCDAAGLPVASAEVGDPDPLSAIGDALDGRRVDEIVVFALGRHVVPAYPLSVVRRAERSTGLPVRGIPAPHAARPSRRLLLTRGHCEPARA
jgi:hypothetical protein